MAGSRERAEIDRAVAASRAHDVIDRDRQGFTVDFSLLAVVVIV